MCKVQFFTSKKQKVQYQSRIKYCSHMNFPLPPYFKLLGVDKIVAG